MASYFKIIEFFKDVLTIETADSRNWNLSFFGLNSTVTSHEEVAQPDRGMFTSTFIPVIADSAPSNKLWVFRHRGFFAYIPQFLVTVTLHVGAIKAIGCNRTSNLN